jgi:thermitase
MSKKIKLSNALLSTILLTSVSAFAAPKIESVPGEFIVRLKKDVITTKSLRSLSETLGAKIKSTIPGQNIVVVQRPVFEIEKSAVKSLSQNELVDIVEPNYIYRMNKMSNDPMIEQLWGLKNVGQKDSGGTAGVKGLDINVEKAWDIQTGSKKTIVAVIDTGVDENHPDLKENMWTNVAELNGKAGVDDDGNGVIDDIHGFNSITGSGNALDDQGHGSHCSGTIGAKGNDGAGIVGVNWDVSIMAVKFLDANGSGTLENAIKSIDYATRMGAKVLSNSWGGGGFSQTLFDSIKRSEAAGAIFIAAAGNDSNNNDASPSYPASYVIDNIVSVAANDNTGKIASFSNFGKNSVHIGAPGVNIYSSTGGKYDSWSGTSMATPHVSGVAALLWSNEPNLTAAQIKQRLLVTARPVSGLRGKTRTGGMVDAYAALTNTAPPPDQNDPANWPTTSLNYASASPYLKNTNETYNIQMATGTKEFALYFEKFDTEGSYDTVQIYDAKGALVQTISGQNDESFSSTITGSVAKIVFKSDGSVEKSGWKITKAAVR